MCQLSSGLTGTVGNVTANGTNDGLSSTQPLNLQHKTSTCQMTVAVSKASFFLLREGTMQPDEVADCEDRAGGRTGLWG